MVARSVNNFQRRRALMWSALWSLGKMWYSQTISLDLKLPLFRTCLSVLSYGCETWIITRDIGMKLNDFASSCCRFILTIKRLDEISNDGIYNLNGISPLLLMVVSHFAHGEGWTCWHVRIVWRCMSLLMGEDPFPSPARDQCFTRLAEMRRKWNTVIYWHEADFANSETYSFTRLNDASTKLCCRRPKRKLEN